MKIEYCLDVFESLKRELRVEDKMPFGILFNSQFSISYLPCEDRIFLHDTVHLLTNAPIVLSHSGAANTVSISSTISPISGSLAPRVVIAGVPTRIPEVWKAERLSNGTMFLFTVMSAATKLLGHLTGQVGELRAQVDQHAVVVRTAGDDLVLCP